MSYEVIDGVLFYADPETGRYRADFPPCGPVDEAVADALDVLRAAGWEIRERPESVWNEEQQRFEHMVYDQAWSPVRGERDDAYEFTREDMPRWEVES